MNSIILGFNVVLPLAVYMTLGFGMKRRNWLSEKTIDEMNIVVFNVFLSALIFLNTYSVDTSTILDEKNLKIISLSVVVVFATIFTANLVCKKLNIAPKRKAIIVQGSYRSNLALFALAITTAIYGEDGGDIVSLIMAVLIPIFNIAAVVILQSSSDVGEDRLKNIIYSVVKNPLVIAALLGLILSAMNFVFPKSIMDILVGLSKVSTPLAFILLGASLEFSNMLSNIKPILVVSLVKLIIVPTVIVFLAIKLGIVGKDLVSLMGCFASPVAVAAYTMAKEVDVEPSLSGEIVAFTTIASMFTIFIFIVGLGNLGFL